MKELEGIRGLQIKYSFNYIVLEGNNWAVKMVLREYGYQEGYDYDEITDNEIAIYL
jgi:hypothetical protein